MEKAPDEYDCGDENESNCLVAAEDAALLCAARLLSGLLLVRLDAGVNHGVRYEIACKPHKMACHASV